MAVNSLAPQTQTQSTQTYHLPEADRQAILAQADKARLDEPINYQQLIKRQQLIDRQRQAFIEQFGSDGLEESCT